MQAPARMLRLLLVALVAALAASTLAAPPAAAATLTVRLEAGPQTGLTFSSTWRVTSRRTVTLAAPVSVTGSARRTEPPGGTWIKLTSGVLAGRWVRESTVAYIAGFTGTSVFSPARTIRLPAARWELYRFDAAGVMTAARGWTTQATTTVHLDRVSVVRGRRHVRIADGSLAGWWTPGSAASPWCITCSAGSPPSSAVPVVVRSVPAATGEIALTFDLGGRLVPALAIVRQL